MVKALELAGQKFGRLMVIDQSQVRALNGSIQWNCLCDCGNKVTARSDHLYSEYTLSCGCLRKEKTATHGMTNTSEYNIWKTMIQRCTNINNQSYPDYGSRGITVCDRWLNSFQAFYEDMGPRPSFDHSMERRENDKGYYKENCYWATRVQQANNRRNNVLYSYKDSQYTISKLIELPEVKESKVPANTITTRVQQLGYTVEQALNRPIRVISTYTHNEVTKTIKEWSREYNVEYHKLYRRLIQLGWSFERAVSE